MVNAFRQAYQNFVDARNFGPAFLLRHFAKLRGAQTTKLRVPGIGLIHVRVGTSDVAAIQQVFGERSYDLGATSPVTARIQRRYEKILSQQKRPVIVDAGANIGAASLWFRMHYPLAGIVAVEPEPGNVSILHRNLDGIGDTFIMDAAIGAESGHVNIEDGTTGWGARTIRSETGIPVVTIQDAIDLVPDGVSFIVKIDIEGFESDLFARNTSWIKDAFVVIIEPHDWMLPGQLSSRSFQRAMAEHDFEVFLSGENLIYIRI